MTEKEYDNYADVQKLMNKAMKKEIIKPFDLEAYKNGAKVRTRDGHEARIICTDAKIHISLSLP